ncbi:hypothetical protein Cni_G03774 [Canna indica]|uniref:Protein kinase domain-containing protein n=1 Tax=Canna indica TaxID=4628 RepID=A0AAQ3JS72_9LILI|nr:hypothetical protein Cni_G03774 [Canna indica]
MASDPRDLHPSRPSDAATPSDHPSTSAPASGGDRKVKLRYSYGGRILPRLGDGALRYVGGETRILTVRADASLQEILRRMADAYGGPVVLRYQLPDEDLDSLVTVSTNEDLENMMEEYEKLAAQDPNAKLRVFLFSPSEVSGNGADALAAYHDFQDTDARYLEAVNGLDSSIRRRDSATSFSSTQNSDGMVANETVINEGMLHAHVSPNSASARDASKMVFARQDAPADQLQTANSGDQTQFPNPSQSEMPSLVPNQNSTQAELPSVTPFVPQPYIDPQHAQMVNPQPFLVMGLPPQINVVAVPPHAYMAPPQPNIPTPQVNGITRMDPSVDHNGGKIAKIPGDARLQPLSQLPPLPPPHLLTPSMERRQVPSSSQGLTIGLEDCGLCQRNLPHAHSDTLLNVQVNGARLPEANAALQTHHSEDLTRTRPPQATDFVLPVDNRVEIQAKNLAAALRTHESKETITEMPPVNVIPVINSANPEHANVVVPPASVGLPGITQASYGTVSNSQMPCKENSVQKQQELPPNIDYSNILLTPASLGMPHNPYGTFVIPSHPQGDSQQKMQFPQQIGLPGYPVSQDFMSQQFASDASLIGNLDFRGDGLAIHGTVPSFMYGYVRPMDGTTQPVYVNPPGVPGFVDQSRPVVFTDIGTSKDLKTEKPPLVMANANNTGPQDRVNELPINNPVIGSVVVQEGSSGLLADQLPSVPRDVAYLQSFQLSNTNHAPNIIGNLGPYSYHLQAGVGPRATFNNVDHTFNNNVISTNPIGEKKDEAPNVHPVEVFNDMTIPHSNSAQLHNNMEQLHQAVSSDPLVSNKDTQKTVESTIMPPRPSIISSKEPTVTKDLYSRNYPASSIVPDRNVPAGGGGSGRTLDSLNIELPTELVNLVKDLEDAHIEQDIQTFEGRVSASALQSSEVSIPVSSSHERKEPSLSSEKECGTLQNKVEIDEQTENKNKPSEKMKNGFPNSDDIGHLQVIKNSDLEELQELGSGTFGTVYHGKWRGTDVAIKRINDRVFSGKSSEQERARADFWNEACKLASLHHPNVVAFYGIVLDGPGGSIATVTEFMVNGSLRRALQKNEKMLDRRRRLLIAMDVAFGMEYLHSKNIIHFDLKSDNLLVNLRDPQRPICKVGDLGLSKVKYETLMSGGMRGTLPWMAPELLGGKDNKYTEKVDVFSFGIVMWELITGEEPYGDMHYGAIIGGILSDTLRPPVPESCDAEWRSLMEQCWATEPLQRPSFTEIASRLRAMAASLPQKG